MILIGKHLSIEHRGYLIQGTVVHYIKGGDRLTPGQMELYAGISKDHKAYKSVRGPAKVDRVVLDKGNGYYFISPVHIFVGDI